MRGKRKYIEVRTVPKLEANQSDSEVLCAEGFGSFMKQVIAERQRLIKALQAISSARKFVEVKKLAVQALKDAGVNE